MNTNYRKLLPGTTLDYFDAREAVDAMNKAAGENGGIADINPVEDHGFMYGRDFVDPDGHVWGAMWIDMSAIPANE